MVSLACNLFRGLWSNFAHEEKEHFLHCSSRAISSITLSACLYLSPTIKTALFWMTLCSFQVTFTYKNLLHTHICISPGRQRCTSTPIPSWSWENAFCHSERYRRENKDRSTKVAVIERRKNSNHCLLGRDNTFIHCRSHAGRHFMGQNNTIQVSEVVWNCIRDHSE